MFGYPKPIYSMYGRQTDNEHFDLSEMNDVEKAELRADKRWGFI